MDTAAHVYQPEHKISKDSAKYTNHSTSEEKCKGCTYFERIEPNHCSRVKGIILPTGWCRLWEAK